LYFDCAAPKPAKPAKAAAAKAAQLPKVIDGFDASGQLVRAKQWDF